MNQLYVSLFSLLISHSIFASPIKTLECPIHGNNDNKLVITIDTSIFQVAEDFRADYSSRTYKGVVQSGLAPQAYNNNYFYFQKVDFDFANTTHAVNVRFLNEDLGVEWNTEETKISYNADYNTLRISYTFWRNNHPDFSGQFIAETYNYHFGYKNKGNKRLEDFQKLISLEDQAGEKINFFYTTHFYKYKKVTPKAIQEMTRKEKRKFKRKGIRPTIEKTEEELVFLDKPAICIIKDQIPI